MSGHAQLATKSFAVELRVDGTLSKSEFRVQPVWDATESGHTMVTARPVPEVGAATVPDVTSDEAEPTEGEVTQVRARVTELYAVEIWRGGVRQTVVPVSKPEITIGRGSKSVTVDLPIKGDPEVSRVHAILGRDPEGKYWLTSKGRNPTTVGGRELPREESTEIAPDDKIEICSYTLRIQPK